VSDQIQIRGLRVVGTHGVLDEEKQRAQPFEIDLDIETDLARAGRSDDLADTIDYGAIVARVAGIAAGDHADLLEHLAQRIADAVLENPGAAGVTVTVRKLRPPVPHDVATTAVRITRRRP
jgi:dihydroneopterin aldolase